MHVLMSCVKDEGPFLIEFVAHHLVLGFDRVMIASNDCRDGSDDLLDALARHGYVQHLRQIVHPDTAPQHAGYAKLRATFGLESVQWAMALDADEFLHVSVGDGTVQALTGAAPTGVDIIALNAKTFGTDLGANWQPGRVCAQFTRRLGLKDRVNGAVKSLTRAPLRFDEMHNHHMVGYHGEEPLQVMRADGTVFLVHENKPLWTQIRVTALNRISHGLAHYNHYAIKTYDSFALRRERGRGAVAPARQRPEKLRHSDDYFAAHMGASIMDTSIAVYAPQVMAKMTQMMAHPDVAAAQAACEARYAHLIHSLAITQTL